jgi:DNA modification methylase
LTADLIIGDVFEALATIPDASVDLVLTSPPFLALRSYLPADHPDKAKEIGSEPTPAAFIDTLLRVTTELRRVLAPHGSICVELGDTYSGSGGAGGDYNTDGLRDGQPKFRAVGSREHRPEREGTSADGGERLVPLNGGPGWPLDKSLTCIPDLYQVALAYGINPLTGIRSPAGRWRVRNKRAWCRPNPPVGALGDKVRPATSYMVMACTAGDRWFDLDAVRQVNNPDRLDERSMSSPRDFENFENGNRGKPTSAPQNPAGAPPLDWVNIPTQPYKGAHYATWPEELCVQPILMMCPERVCVTCGEASRRIVEGSYVGAKSGDPYTPHVWASGIADKGAHSNKAPDEGAVRLNTTLGWTDCGHGNWRPGVVLDPFCGSGTSLQVATRLGRDAIGIDLDPRNEKLICARVGLFMGDVRTV